MSKSLKTILGILSFLGFLIVPILIGYMFMSFIPAMVEFEQQGVEPTFQDIWPHLGALVGISIFMSLLSLGLMIFFIIHVLQDTSATSNDKILWVLLLFFFSSMVFPFYWYFRIVRNDSVGPSKEKSIGYTN
ncbi:MAG: hypothetical protein HKN79_04865 [Flavobacteriales bacterium]|nr:hypothetical protein [Flavobacteriales bacterium]